MCKTAPLEGRCEYRAEREDTCLNTGIKAHIFRHPLLEGIYCATLICLYEKRNTFVNINKRGIKGKFKPCQLSHL